MSKISIKFPVEYGDRFSEEDIVQLDPEKTVDCYTVCLKVLEKLGELSRMLEVIRVSFFQKQAKSLLVRFSVVYSDPFGGPKSERNLDYTYLTTLTDEAIDFIAKRLAKEVIYSLGPKVSEQEELLAGLRKQLTNFSENVRKA